MSNSSFNWEIPEGQTDGELCSIDLGVGSDHRSIDHRYSAGETIVLQKLVVFEDLLQSSIGRNEEIFVRGANNQIWGKEFRRDGIESGGKSYGRRIRTIREVRWLHCSGRNRYEMGRHE
ncbi:hypothetical protein CEXT_13671 [Caerostris extrusa]|uniref:Uncharacterized protein n=1 Tax=Caerostris extrusa TaxID=172846 RepID=A0AAV4YDA4_CAEEX|nr:hypothetical protein CEXT_13671 [Caerostris extrusa]